MKSPVFSLALSLALVALFAPIAGSFFAPTLSLRRIGTRAHFSPVLSGADGNDAEDTVDEEGAALAAAFASRLEEEGGATQFKIKTSVNDATDSIKDTLGSVANTAKNVDVDTSSPAVVIGGLFAVVIIFTVLTSGGNKSDLSTSDGTTLEFGKRSEMRDPAFNNDAYRAEYGRQ